jgi:hypothetical protein
VLRGYHEVIKAGRYLPEHEIESSETIREYLSLGDVAGSSTRALRGDWNEEGKLVLNA